MSTYFSDYQAARQRNRKLFAKAQPGGSKVFEIVLHNAQLLGEELITHRDSKGSSHVSLAPFYLIFQRQTSTAFEALSANQAFQAWVSIRPAIESVLIMGKWVHDPANATIWKKRIENPSAYMECYQGKRLAQGALPRSKEIQGALRAINDNYLHPNPSYYFRHLRIEEPQDRDLVEVHLDFFDDEDDVWLGFLGIVHLLLVCQDSISKMLNALFVDQPTFDVGLRDFEARAWEWASSLRTKSAFHNRTLTELGLWPTAI